MCTDQALTQVVKLISSTSGFNLEATFRPSPFPMVIFSHPTLCDLLTGTRSSGIRIFIVDPNLLPVEVFLLLKIEFDLPPDSEVRPSGTSALERRTDGRFGVDPSVVLRPVGTKIFIDGYD